MKLYRKNEIYPYEYSRRTIEIQQQKETEQLQGYQANSSIKWHGNIICETHYHEQDDVDNNNNGIIIYTRTRNVAGPLYINSQSRRTNGEPRQDERE